MSDKLKNLLVRTLSGAVLLLVVGYIFVRNVPHLDYLEAGILYFASVVGAGLFWVGANLGK